MSSPYSCLTWWLVRVFLMVSNSKPPSSSSKLVNNSRTITGEDMTKISLGQNGGMDPLKRMIMQIKALRVSLVKKAGMS